MHDLFHVTAVILRENSGDSSTRIRIINSSQERSPASSCSCKYANNVVCTLLLSSPAGANCNSFPQFILCLYLFDAVSFRAKTNLA